jgi:preprotein translocase subunit YajC
MTHSFSLSLLALQGGFGGAGAAFLFPIAAIFAIFYFLLIRPQQKQRREHEARLRALKKGDRVVTSGGMIGEVVHLKETMKDGTAEKSMDDEITLKSAESRFVVERRGIARVAATE